MFNYPCSRLLAVFSTVLLLTSSLHAATEKLLNGGFENGSLANWSTIYVANSPDTSFASSLESTEPLSGDHSARLDFKGPETDNWRMRFEQLFSTQADNFYRARFLVRSSHAITLQVQFIDNPEYASVGVQRLLVTEYAYDAMRMRPGSNLAMVRLMEEGLVDAATSSCWNHLRECTGNSSCFDGTLSGMLTCDRSAPRPLWWAKKWYADSVNGRVAATTNNQAIVPIASNHTGSGQVILASRGYTGPPVDMTEVTVHFNNLVAAGIADSGDTQIPIYVYRAPYTDLDAVHSALPEPILVTATTVPISEGSASFTLSGTVNAYDAVLIRFSEAETLDFSPPPVGQWTGAGGNAILGNAANWAESTLPTDDTALWNGPGSEPLQLAFNANFGTRADESGTRFRLGSGQSGDLSITNNAGASRDINWLSSTTIDGFHM